jgi:hypothetical protein
MKGAPAVDDEMSNVGWGAHERGRVENRLCERVRRSVRARRGRLFRRQAVLAVRTGRAAGVRIGGAVRGSAAAIVRPAGAYVVRLAGPAAASDHDRETGQEQRRESLARMRL